MALGILRRLGDDGLEVPGVQIVTGFARELPRRRPRFPERQQAIAERAHHGLFAIASRIRNAPPSIATASEADANAYVGFETPLALPQQTQKLRARLTTRQPGTKLGPASVEGRRLRVPLITAERGFGPGQALKIRFDCPTGSRVAAKGFSCVAEEIANAAGEPIAESLAREVRCVVELDPGAR